MERGSWNARRGRLMSHFLGDCAGRRDDRRECRARAIEATARRSPRRPDAVVPQPYRLRIREWRVRLRHMGYHPLPPPAHALSAYRAHAPARGFRDVRGCIRFGDLFERGHLSRGARRAVRLVERGPRQEGLRHPPSRLSMSQATIDAVETPALALDVTKVERNIARLTGRLASLGVGFRPHMKTAKSTEVARRLFAQG